MCLFNRNYADIPSEPLLMSVQVRLCIWVYFSLVVLRLCMDPDLPCYCDASNASPGFHFTVRNSSCLLGEDCPSVRMLDLFGAVEAGQSSSQVLS